MTPAQYRAALKRLGLTVVGAAEPFGMSRRQAQRLGAKSNPSPVPKLVAKVIRLLLDGDLTLDDLK